MARFRDDEDTDLSGYLGGFFGGDSGGSSGGGNYNYTDPNVHATGNMIDLGVGPASDNSPAAIAEQNRMYGGAQGGQPVQSWLQQYQKGNQASEGLDRTLQGLKAAGYNAAPYMYGSTPSNNELLINGEKRKIIGGEDTSNPYWYQWGSDDSGGGGGDNNGYGGGAPRGGTGFADPAYQQLNDLVQRRLASLQQPVQFPQLDAYMQMLREQQAAAKQRAQVFADQLTGRISQLQQPLLSDANVVNQRALASNNLLKQRDAALKNKQESLYARGFEPSSGLLEGSNRAIEEAYTGAQSNIDAQLQAQSIAQDEQRRNQATQLQGLVQQALQGGDLTALQEAAQMSDLENQMFNINQNREREQLTTANIPVDLTNMGFANALNASNSNQNPLGAIFSLIAAGQGQQGLQQAQSNSNMGALAWLLQQALG